MAEKIGQNLCPLAIDQQSIKKQEIGGPVLLISAGPVQWRLSSNVIHRLNQKFGHSIGDKIKFYRATKLIENDPRLQFNPNPRFNHIYPLQTKKGEKVLQFVEENIKNQYGFNNAEYAFRNPSYPRGETYFSSSENRKRYENILLNKGFEIMQKIDNINAPGLRPLGMTNPTKKTLGTGTHFFTWRNISNTCPLVFWWEFNGWQPLFRRKAGVNWFL